MEHGMSFQVTGAAIDGQMTTARSSFVVETTVAHGGTVGQFHPNICRQASTACT